MDSFDSDGEDRLNGIQAVASSILVSSTTAITPFPLVFVTCLLTLYQP